MQLIGKHHLELVLGSSEEIDMWISAWVTEVSHSSWKDPRSVLDAYPRAIDVDGTVFLFHVCGNEFPQIKIKIRFGLDKAMICKVILQ
ncbi:type II toxin-antitoxin system HigB family toxin [Vibrio parahaemolyticus]|uniref:type II toxin-antitoxin system HigB family toxin n=1 Tax=Vibrio parahaemolyticus TaxID=670 RepID=UPI0013EE411E|nr:type II toxin-antitoxin system HigB family toxin [Vibrio parahaemolyticus]